MKSQRKFPFALFISGLMHLQRGRFFEDNQKKSAQCVALSNLNTAQHQHQTKRDSKKYPGNHIFIFSSRYIIVTEINFDWGRKKNNYQYNVWGSTGGILSLNPIKLGGGQICPHPHVVAYTHVCMRIHVPIFF